MKNKLYIEEFKRYFSKNSRGTNSVLLAAYLLILSSVIFFNHLYNAHFSFDIGHYQVGKPALSDYRLKKDLRYYDETETNLKRTAAERTVLPVYRVDQEITVRILANFTSFKDAFTTIVNESEDDELFIQRMKFVMPDGLRGKELLALKESDWPLIFETVSRELKETLFRGLIDPEDKLKNNSSGLINVVSLREDGVLVDTPASYYVMKQRSEPIDIGKEYDFFKKKLSDYFLYPNCFYDEVQSRLNREEAVRSVEPVIKNYREGLQLAYKGYIISAIEYDKIVRAEESLRQNTLSVVLSVIVFVSFLFFAAFVLYSKRFSGTSLTHTETLLLTGTFVAFTAIYFIVSYFFEESSPDLIPVLLPSVFFTMLVTFLIGSRTGFFTSLLLALLSFLLSGYSSYEFLVVLFFSLAGTALVHDVDKRIDLIKASFIIALLQILILLFMNTTGFVQAEGLFSLVLLGGASGIVSGILTLAVLPLFEHFLKICTTFQLKELCDLNAPVLKTMLIKAPGTYAHSIAVASMAESAARAIGCNPLLAKAGGFYHDIGKIDQSLYFIENQRGEKNYHDEMKASLSAAVIKSHVKMGIEKAREIGLPRVIIDIIEQHHGKSLIAFFYDKAQKEKGEGGVLEEDYSYPGPVPGTREAAIVMLADTVEAATRSMKKPSIAQLDKFIWDLIMKKFKEGALGACGMKLSDLTDIREAFLHSLMGQFHTRIEYPGNNGEEDE